MLLSQLHEYPNPLFFFFFFLVCHRGLFLSRFPFVCSASPALLKSLSSFHNKLTCSANFHFSSVTPTAAPPHQCNCFCLLAHLYAPSLCSPSDYLCFHAGSTHLFLDWYKPKLPLTFRLWTSSTSLLSLSACGLVALRLFLLNSNSCLKVRILTQLWREPTAQPVRHVNPNRSLSQSRNFGLVPTPTRCLSWAQASRRKQKHLP